MLQQKCKISEAKFLHDEKENKKFKKKTLPNKKYLSKKNAFFSLNLRTITHNNNLR